jgi:tetratricopeptide (TPR) repeat protein
MSKQQKKATNKVETVSRVANSPTNTSEQKGKTALFYAGILAAIALVLYLPTLGHGFVLDDPLVTTLNAYVQKGFAGLGDIFTHSYRAGSSVSTDSEYMYRPLSVAMFAIEWAVVPKNAGIHHFMNVLWYAFSIGLTFLFLRKMLGAERWLIAFGATLLFAIHPLHVEVVANIKSRDEIMSYCFSILSLYFLFEATEGKPKRTVYAIVAFLLAMLAKEGAVTLLFIAPLALYVFGNKEDWRSGLVLFVPFILWFLVRYAIMGKLSYTPDFNDNQLVAASLMERWATGFGVLAKYLQLLILPIGLSWDYSFNMIPTVGWGSPWSIGSLVLHLGLVGFGIWGIRQKNVFAYCALAYLASMALYSNLLMLIGTMMGDRLTYQASLWFCLAVVLLLAKVLKFEGDSNLNTWLPGKNAMALLGATGAIALLGALLSFQRSAAWKDNYTLVTTDAKTAAGSFRALQAIGEETLLKYADKATPPKDTAALLQQSLDGFERSHQIRPTFNNALGMGNVAYFKKNYAKAAQYFEESYKLMPGKMSKERLVTTYREWGRYEGQVKGNLPQAIEYFQKSFAYDSTDTQTLIDLGTAYAMSQKPDRAVVYMEKALKSSPKDEVLRRNLAIAYQQLGMADKAAAIMSGK